MQQMNPASIEHSAHYIACGSFGNVYEHRIHSCTAESVLLASYATKQSRKAEYANNVEREFHILQEVQAHPHIVRVYGFSSATDIHPAVMYMEYAGKRALVDCVYSIDAVRVVPQLGSAVAHLHRRLICHRDIKLDNIVLSDDTLTIRLVDFGLACRFDPDVDPPLCDCVGSLAYCAPEVYAET